VGREFSSDHVAPACEEILAAVNEANRGFVTSYGGDALTAQLQQAACEVFDREVAIYPVISGTAANALALSQIVPTFGAIYCYELAHIITDEAGAPGFFTGGAQIIGFPASDGKIRPEQITRAVAFADDLGIHHVKPGAVTLTQATEWGTVYSLEEIDAISATAKKHALPLHIDGARFANALARLKCTPAEATWKRGVDVLSLGATKNGALGADAVVFFNQALAQDFERRRKRAGHLMSKLRFVSAQLLAYLKNDLWLKNARHANAMAERLAYGLRGLTAVRLMQSVDANELFLAMPERIAAALEAQGFHFYRWNYLIPDDGVPIRLVTSFATSSADVDDFLKAIVAAARSPE
jgi:threonine aldolase